MTERGPLIDLKFRLACLALAAGALVFAGRASSAGLLEVWRSAFTRHDGVKPVDGAAVALKTALGKKLFRDPRLSGGGRRACISCHKPELGFTDGLKRARALPGSMVTLRNTPTLYSLSTAQVFNWDGSATSLEQQVRGPIQNPGELAASFDVIVSRLEKDGALAKAFARAFSQTPVISQDTISRALASYVRSLSAPQSRFDSWIRGDTTAMTETERAGFQIFVGKGGCVACHAGPRFIDGSFHDIGLPDDEFFGGQDVAGKKGVRAFKTPTLRAISKTAPYMHNGSLNTLSDVVNHYADGGVQRRGVSGVLPPQLDLSDDDKAALVTFLATL